MPTTVRVKEGGSNLIMLVGISSAAQAIILHPLSITNSTTKTPCGMEPIAQTQLGAPLILLRGSVQNYLYPLMMTLKCACVEIKVLVMRTRHFSSLKYTFNNF